MPNPNDITILAGIQMAQDFVSPSVCVVRNTAYSFQSVWTGIPTGIFTLESSSETARDPINILPTHFDPIITSPAGGLDGSLTISWSLPIPYNWVRIKYTYQSGSGLLISLNFNGR